MDPIETITGAVSHLDRSNVDTDQIMPKQFLKRVCLLYTSPSPRD